MGLDWKPLGRPRAGHDREHAELVGRFQRSEQDEASIKRFQEICEPPYETLGAPRVGIDELADAWLREKLAANGRSDEFAAACQAMRGYYVLELLPPSDGFPVYSNGGLYEGVDRCSFRGAFLKDVLDLIGDEGFERSYAIMTAEELRAYGSDLLEIARRYASETGNADVESIRDEPFEDGAPRTRAHILFAAAKWCLFWSERGFGLEPDF